MTITAITFLLYTMSFHYYGCPRDSLGGHRPITYHDGIRLHGEGPGAPHLGGNQRVGCVLGDPHDGGLAGDEGHNNRQLSLQLALKVFGLHRYCVEILLPATTQ